MNKDSIQEMEQIQKGLESFLQQEVEGYRDKAGPDAGPAEDEIDIIAFNGSASGTAREQKAPGIKMPETAAANRVRRIREPEPDLQAGPELEAEPGWEPGHDLKPGRVMKPGQKLNPEPEMHRAGQKGRKDPEETAVRRAKEPRQDGNRKAPGAPEPTAKGKPEAKRTKGRQNADNGKTGENVKKAGNGRKGRGKDEQKGRGKKKGSAFRKILVVLVLLAVIVGAGWYTLVGAVYAKMKYEEVASVTDAPMKEEGVTNILLIGNDSRTQGEDGRSDAMILLSISSRTGTIHMTSLLRDIYVEIPGYKSNRLNAAYSYGGAELLMETIEQNLDISVNRYVLVNFQAFANLVDAVGGVDLELTSEEVRYINGYLVEYNILEGRAEGTDYLDESLSGVIHLNGPQALAFSRNRYLGTDFGRTERQRKVLSAVMKQLPSALLTNPKGLMDGLLPNLTTNLTKGECLSLSLQAGKLLTYEIVQSSIPIEGSFSNKNIRGMAVLEVDFGKNKEYIRKNIYGEE